MNDPAVSPMTDAELLDLSGLIEALRDEVTAAPAMYSFDDPLGPLAESDYAALNAAKVVIDRLYRWRHWNAPANRCYLPSPAPVAEPQSLRRDAPRLFVPFRYTVNPFRVQS